MKIDLTIVQIALIFLPGIIWAGLDARFAAKKTYTPFETAVNSFLFGVVCYVATFLAYSFMGWSFDVFDQIGSGAAGVNFKAIVDDILVSTSLSLALGLGWVYATNKKVFVKILQKIGAAKKYGDEDVWNFIFNSNNPMSEYVYFRDFERKLVYSGWVEAFSDSEKSRELLLRDVEVYDFEGRLMFSSPHIYVTGKQDAMLIEFPYKQAQNGVEPRGENSETE